MRWWPRPEHWRARWSQKFVGHLVLPRRRAMRNSLSGGKRTRCRFRQRRSAHLGGGRGDPGGAEIGCGGRGIPIAGANWSGTIAAPSVRENLVLWWGQARRQERLCARLNIWDPAHAGGLHAIALRTGKRVWYTPPPKPICRSGPGCTGARRGADGNRRCGIRGLGGWRLAAYATKDGSVIGRSTPMAIFPPSTGPPMVAR
jgi:hypothetical protein